MINVHISLSLTGRGFKNTFYSKYKKQPSESSEQGGWGVTDLNDV